MKNFKKKAEELDKLKNELDDYVWIIFKRYIDMEIIHFNSPDSWKVSGETIYFNGSDGCMGCYDNMSCVIPMNFFDNPDEAFPTRIIEIENEKKKEVRKEKLLKIYKEKKLLKKLKEKYEK